ncbi:MAG: UDP-glucose--hexose-1-phosphate uridylyltransferase [Anaerolineae bacterium]|nr:UDP-glucose--hexose-1-phosphate uridylyltransferase [Anaerolineae bacterium]
MSDIPFDRTEHPHRRYNPLLDEYVLVSPHRMKRPWQGSQEKLPPVERPQHDPKCYLCPGNTRANGVTNPDYQQTYVFDNDFRSLLDGVPEAPASAHPLLTAETVQGTNRVICFSPRHDLTLAQMPVDEVRTVVDLWADQTTELGQTYKWVQVFENRGEMMGSSNPHPHGQIWAENVLPNFVAKEHATQRSYTQKNGSVMLMDYAELEIQQGERIVIQNDDWLVVVPFWATWPFETLLLPKDHILRLPDLTDTQRDTLADILKQLLIRYDNLFEVSFPYSMGWHGAPFIDEALDHWQLHAHFYPPLLRSATVRKFMVGYEMLGEPQRDLTAEQAAARLRDLSPVHYLEHN